MARPSLGLGSASDLIFGIGSHLKFAEQEAGATQTARKKDSANDFSKYNIAVNSMTVSPASTLLTPGVIPTTVEQFQGVPGPLSIAGSFTLDALPKRMELIWRQLLNAPSSGITDITSGDAIGTGTNQDILTATAIPGGTNSISTFTAQPTNGLPIQLTGTLGAGAMVGGSGISAANPLSAQITGTDYSHNTFTDIITFTSDTGTATTSSYFRSVSSVSFFGAGTVGNTGTLALAGQSNRNGVQIVSDADYRLTSGLTIEAVNGSGTDRSVTNTIIDGYINSFNWTAAREENITYTFGLTGRTFEAGVNPAGENTPLTGRSGGTAYGSGDFATLQDDQVPYAGYGACLGFTDGSTTVNFPHLTGASMTMDNATQFTPRLWTIQPGLVYNRQRTISGEFTLEYHKSDQGVVNDYLAGRTWDNVFISLGNRGIGAVPDETIFRFPKLQLTEYPAIPIEDDDFVQQTIRWVALPSTGTAADAVTIQCYYDNIFYDGNPSNTVELSKSNLGLVSLP